MIGDKIKELRKHLHLSQADFSSKIGIGQGHLSEIERNISTPGANIVLSVIRLFPDINIDFLTGEGEMYTRKEGILEEERKKEPTSYSATVYPALNAPLTPAQQAINANAKTTTPTINANSPAHTPAPAHHNRPQNNLLTPTQQAINANAETNTIKNSPYFYEAIGKNLALHEEDIREGDILIIDPTITPLQGELTLQGTPDGPKFTRYHPSHTNTKGVVVGLTRQYPAINRQPT